MNVLICQKVCPLLEQYHDGELPVGDQIAARAHLAWCDECAAALADLFLMRGLIRATSSGQALLNWENRAAFQTGVIGRAAAEDRGSWSSLVRDVIDDRSVVYAGIGAGAAAVFCVLILFSMIRLATRERPDSLAAIATFAASPRVAAEDANASGTNANPVLMDARMLMPRVLEQLFLSAASVTDESEFTLSAVLTREGRLVNVEWHSRNGRQPKRGSSEAEAVYTLVNIASVARFEPVRVAGLPIAANMVWLVANTTVRAPKI